MKSIKYIASAACFAICMVTASNMNAQDAHYSQFDASPLLLNPATAGMYSMSDWRVAGNFRSQWGSISTNFLTTAISFDKPYKDRYGIGGYIQNYDMASVINVLNFMVGGAYEITEPGNGDYMITGGLQLGFMVKSINQSKLIFDNQYDNGLFDDDLPHGESFVRGSKFSPDVNMGMFYKSLDNSKDFVPWGGLSVYHVTMPKDVFISDVKVRVPVRWVLSGGGTYDIDEKWDVMPSLLYMKQRADSQFDITMLGKYLLEETDYHLLGGFGWRSSDSFMVHAGVHHKENIFRISYDFNVSGLQNFTNSKGAIEFSILYYGFNKIKNKDLNNEEPALDFFK